jgi:hypothetical protein
MPGFFAFVFEAKLQPNRLHLQLHLHHHQQSNLK